MDLLKTQEVLRAKHVIAKAERDGENVGQSLRDHGVSSSIVQDLIGEVSDYVAKKKRAKSGDVLAEWAKTHIGQHTCPADIAKETNLSYATANNFVGARRDLFTRIKKGSYLVKDPSIERGDS